MTSLSLILEFQRRFIRLLALRRVYESLLNLDGVALIELALFSTYLDLRDLDHEAWAQRYLEARLEIETCLTR